MNANYSAGTTVPSFEIDLFGRLRSLTHAQLQQYLATEAGARSTRLTLVADVADAWLNYASDQSLLVIAQETLKSAQASVRITRIRLEGGIAPRLDLDQAQLILTQAQADVANQTNAARPGRERSSTSGRRADSSEPASEIDGRRNAAHR